MKKWCKNSIIVIITILVVSFIFPLYAVSANDVSDGNVEVTSYELKDESNFAIKDATKVNKFFYGDVSIGYMSIDGDVNEKTSYNGFTAYPSIGDLKLKFNYDGSYHTNNKDKWNISDSDDKKISGCEVDKIKSGAILVQSSLDGENWEKKFSLSDIFDKNLSCLKDFYTISEKDIRKGTYYRISVAYEMSIRTKNGNIKDEYETKKCLEVYKFYACYDADPVVFKDVNTGKASDYSSKESFSSGFVFDKGGTNYNVTVSKDGKKAENAVNNSSFYEKGDYVFEITSELGKKYTRKVTITHGNFMSDLNPNVYEGGKKGEYNEEPEFNKGNASTIKHSLTTLKIGHNGYENAVVSQKQSIPAYGVTGDTVGLYLKLDKVPSGWEICDDDWGKKKKQTVNGTWVGEVRRGALLVQKSNDGSSWQGAGNDLYSDGLHTTDYSNYYAGNGDMLVFTPKGNDIINGIYLKITYAYKLRNKSSGEENRCIEVYTFYLCSSDLDAVTIHNLTIQNNPNKYLDDYNGVEAEIHKGAETLKSGSSSVTGFSVDTSKNNTVDYTISKDGKKYKMPENGKITETGRYVVELRSAVGTTKKVVIFVDNRTPQEALKGYFGECYITGKRIYSEDKFPRFEGGKTSYNIEPSDNGFRNVTGTLKNLTSGDEKTIVPKTAKQTEIIKYPGLYKAVFTTRPNDSDFPGDYWIFTFNFNVIEEGSAPGPVINKNSLDEYSYKNVSDLYPLYYGVTDKSNSHDITVAFSSYEDALKFALALEQYEAEEQEDGSYRYKNTEQDTQKVVYPDNRSVTAAEYIFAEKRIQPLYFDLSDQYSYVTIKDKEIENAEDLRDLDLNSSVIIAGDGEKQKSSKINAYKYPLISPKPYVYLSSKDGTVEKGFNDFKLVKDINGYDSDSFNIIDENGKVYDIGYGDKVGEKLEQQGCPSGIITITEETCYGDTTTYNAVFIAKDDNMAELSLVCTTDGEESELIFTQDNNGQVFDTDYFRLSQINDLLDPCTLVKISYKKDEALENEYYIADTLSDKVWSMKGEYTISVINRLGYSYSLTANVSGNAEIVLDFQGEGENISTAYGAKNVKLPSLTKTGYRLIGFEDENGAVYSDEIAEIMYKGNTVLKAVWEAKEYKLTYIDADGKTISDCTVKYGDTVKLSAPKVGKGMEFVGWMNNGNLIKGDTITIDSENDIVLTASVRTVSLRRKLRNVLVVGSVLVLVLVVLIIILTKVKGGKRHENA